MNEQPKRTWFHDIRWGELVTAIISAALAAGGAVIQTGGTWRQAQTAAAAAAMIAAAAFMRNPKDLKWEQPDELGS